MGIREEIKRLADCRYRAIRRINAICDRCEWVDDYGCFYADAKGMVMASYLGNELEILYKVLSILDEHLGECVAKQTLTNKHNIEQFKKITFGSFLKKVRLASGDRIIIYRIRGSDDALS